MLKPWPCLSFLGCMETSDRVKASILGRGRRREWLQGFLLLMPAFQSCAGNNIHKQLLERPRAKGVEPSGSGEETNLSRLEPHTQPLSIPMSIHAS